MDGQRFDELARKLGSGLSRRQMVRVLLGGAGALTTTAILRDQVSAQVGQIGDPCEDDEDCSIDLTCGPGASGCRCEANENTITCPAGTQHAGQFKKDVGTCCNGNGNCCTNNCVDNICAADPCADCTAEQVCCDNQCATGECCTFEDCTDTEDCYRVACVENLCEYTPTNDLCEEDCEVCNADGQCVSDCGSGEICCTDECVTGDCCDATDCDPVTCGRVSCSNHTCGAVSLCPPQGGANIECCPVEGGEDYCFNADEGECCTVEDCLQVSLANDTCLEVACIEGLCVDIPDDSNCDKDKCCCEKDGSCSFDCCDDGCKSDKECPKDSICCAGACREIECCIDDILTGGDPNDRCPDGCTCFEGICVGKDQQRCFHCSQDKDCAAGTCCCKDGSCSSNCCPGTTSPPIGQLPNTGAGPDEGGASWIAGAALLGGAAALIGSKIIKNGVPPAEEPES